MLKRILQLIPIFVIPFMETTGLYMKGDPDIFVLADTNDKVYEYRVPNDHRCA